MPDSSRPLTVAVIGNPNTGKSTLFTALTGVHSRIGNYPGVTVEKKTGQFTHAGQTVHLVDLPGTYSLSPRSPDERVSVDVLLGRQPDVGPIDGVLCIVDASNLERNLYVVSQVLDLGLPVLLVLNMWDVALNRGLKIDVPELQRRLHVPVIHCEAHRLTHLEEILTALVRLAGRVVPDAPRVFPQEFYDESRQLESTLRSWGADDVPGPLIGRLLLDKDGQIELDLEARYPGRVSTLLAKIRERLKSQGCRIPGVEAKARYAWARQLLHGVVDAPQGRQTTASDRLDRFFTHKVWGLAAFVLMMFVIFQAISVGAEPLMNACGEVQKWVGAQVGWLLPPGPLRSLMVDGVIAGVGGVLVFLPQIALLFLFIAALEDCGYMARAAFVMDKLMSQIGLSGKSFVPLMSSFACAIPGIMATRTIENRRDRFVTILVAPLMSCSARWPVYWLMIAAFIPPMTFAQGWIKLHGLMLFAMSSLGALVAIPVAWILKQTFFRGETPPFVMELPSYKWPSPRIVAHRVWDQAMAFVTRAGTLIMATTILVWAASYFPESHSAEDRLVGRIEELGKEKQPELKRRGEAEQHLKKLQAEIAARPAAGARDETGAELSWRVAELEAELSVLNGALRSYEAVVDERNVESERLLERSYLGRLGKTLEPAFSPLGWDWKIGVGVLASFPAREVIIATLGTIYSLGSDVDEKNQGLHAALQRETWPDGRPVYTIPVALSVMVFFALCAQCASTLMIIRRETNSWFWPAFTFVYMTALAYLGALATYQIATLIGA